jgi:hypothetical protein
MPWVGRLTTPGKLPARKDDESGAYDDERSAPRNDGYREKPMGERERHSQLQGDGRQERNAKDHLEYLPPTLVCGVHACHPHPVTP